MELFRRGEVLPEGRSTETEEKLSGQATRFHPAPTSDMTILLTDTFSRLKILLIDGTGLWVCTKRLEEGTFSWPRHIEPNTTKFRLTPEALALLTDGVDLRGAQLRPWYERPASNP